jgi:hypothetical protein
MPAHILHLLPEVHVLQACFLQGGAMDARGLLALIRAVVVLLLRYCLKGHGSFSVEVKRKDAACVVVTLRFGDHEVFEVPIRQVQKYLGDHPDLA